MMWHVERAAAKEAAGKLGRIWIMAMLVAAIVVTVAVAPRLVGEDVTYRVQHALD